MQRPDGQLWVSGKLVIGLAAFLTLSACTTFYSQEEKYEGPRDCFVPAPVIMDPEALATAQQRRIKVASIQVTAPDRNAKILAASAFVHQKPRQKVFEASGDYYFDQDLAPYTRQALAYLFQIDPASNKTATIEARVFLNNGLEQSTGLCRYQWQTQISAGFVLTLTDTTDSTKTRRTYYSKRKEETCANVYYLPEAEGIGEEIQEAFQASLLKAIERNSTFED